MRVSACIKEAIVKPLLKIPLFESHYHSVSKVIFGHFDGRPTSGTGEQMYPCWFCWPSHLRHSKHFRLQLSTCFVTINTGWRFWVKGAFYQPHLIDLVYPYLDKKCLTTVIHVLLISKMDCCNALCIGLPLKLVWKVQKVQNSAAWLSTVPPPLLWVQISTDMSTHTQFWHVSFHPQLKVVIITYKALNGLELEYQNSSPTK